MPPVRPFRFGATAGKAGSATEWRDTARRAEALGYSTLFLPDHFNDQLAPLPALATAAEATSTLRVGTLVICNDFKHPAMVTKELATMDLLTDGRVEWGMGAGWFPFDYSTTGLAFDEPRVRVDRLVESISVMKGLFGGESFSFTGEHYTIQDLAGTPLPVQRPHPPLLIGAARERMLRLAAREADIIGIAPSTDSRPLGSRPPLMSVTESTANQLEWVRSSAGRRFDQIELQMVAFPATVTADADHQVANLAKAFGIEPAEVRASPHILVGSVEEICDLLEARRDRWGVSYWVVATAAMESFAPVVERLRGR
jgi:probable F420-dependent oxidoreductase